MTQTQSTVHGPVAIKNVANFMAMVIRLQERDPHLPGLAVCSGYSGLGKTYASLYAQNKTNAIRVEVGDSWTRRTLLRAILKELGEQHVKERLPIAELAGMVIERMGDDPRRPLFVDEADKLVDRNMIEIVREVHEHTGAPIVLIGEERLPAKLLTVERVHNRVLDWFQAQPCDFEDARELAKAFCPKLIVEDELLKHLVAMSGGRARRIVVNLARGAELARNKSAKQLGLDLWGKTPVYTGEPPTIRHVEPFKKLAKVA